MNGRALSPSNVVAAAVFIGGMFMVALPHHALTIVQVVIITAAVSVGLYALAANVPTTGWLFPYSWLSPFSPKSHPDILGHRSAALDSLGARMGDRRQPMEDGPALPPAILRELKLLIAAALEMDPDDYTQVVEARDRVTPLTYAVLKSDPLKRATWWSTVQPHRQQTAVVVHRVLDDLDRLMPGAIHPDTMSSAPRA